MASETTPTNLPIRCFCGTVRGVLTGASSKIGRRVICYCDDCQAFANYLSTDCGILDHNGGTDIFQVSPARLAFRQGKDQLACLRLTPKGTVRWYTSCCRTPIGNTLPTGKLPFVGLIHSCMDPGGRSLSEILGPVRARVMARYAIGELNVVDAYDKFSPAILAGFIFDAIRWRIRGDHIYSPFFDPVTDEPVAVPQIISDIKN